MYHTCDVDNDKEAQYIPPHTRILRHYIFQHLQQLIVTAQGPTGSHLPYAQPHINKYLRVFLDRVQEERFHCTLTELRLI